MVRMVLAESSDKSGSALNASCRTGEASDAVIVWFFCLNLMPVQYSSCGVNVGVQCSTCSFPVSSLKLTLPVQSHS